MQLRSNEMGLADKPIAGEKRFESFLDGLDNYQYVAKFQQICGLKEIPKEKASEKGNTKQCSSSGRHYVITRPWLHQYFQFSRHGGEEVLFLLLFPFIMWCIDTWTMRRVSFCFTFSMFVCTAMKDIVCKQRPSAPPVLRLEVRSADEFSLPSTHAVAITSTFVPLLVVYHNRYPDNLSPRTTLILWVALIWSIISVCLSRIYNGMHTFMDVLCGLVITMLMITSSMRKVDILIDFYLMKDNYAPIVIVLSGFVLCALYPKVEKWNTGRGDSILLMGMHVGYLVATWFNFAVLQMESDEKPEEYNSMDNSTLQPFKPLLRMLVGLPLVFIMRLAVRYVVMRIVCAVLRLNPKDPNTKQIPLVELLHKYFSYVTIGFLGVAYIPQLFPYLNIS